MEFARSVEISPDAVTKPWILGPHPDDIHLGGSEPDLVFDKCEVYVGDRPVVFDFQHSVIKALEKRIEEGDTTDQADEDRLESVKRLRPHWRYYMLIYGVGVSNCRKLRELRFGVTYDDSDETPVTIVDLWPRSEHMKVFQGSAEASASVDMFGRFSAEDLPDSSLMSSLPLPFGAKMEFGGQGTLVGRLSTEISWPVVEAFGMASSTGKWMVRRSKYHKMNQQLFCHVIHTQRDVSEISARVTVDGVYRGTFETPATSTAELALKPIVLDEE